MQGATIGDWVVLFPAGPESVKETSYVVSPDSWTHFLCGLVPEGSYDVLLDGSWEGILKASREGTLHFETSSASTVTLRSRS